MRPSCSCTKGLRPLDSNSGNSLTGGKVLVPAAAGRNAEVRLDDVALSGPAAKPPSRMLRIRGKPGNNPRGKLVFPWDFPWLSWARSHQAFVTPVQMAIFVFSSQLVCPPKWVQGPMAPGAGLGARSAQRNPLYRYSLVAYCVPFSQRLNNSRKQKPPGSRWLFVYGD